MQVPKLTNLKLHTDDRGFVYCAMDNMNELGIKRTYFVENFSKGTVRAWHLHLKGDTYFHVIRGAIKAAALKYCPYEGTSGEPKVFTLSERNPQVLKFPAGWYNGACSLSDNTKLLVYSTLSFDEVKDDDNRLSYKAFESIWGVKHR